MDSNNNNIITVVNQIQHMIQSNARNLHFTNSHNVYIWSDGSDILAVCTRLGSGDALGCGSVEIGIGVVQVFTLGVSDILALCSDDTL